MPCLWHSSAICLRCPFYRCIHNIEIGIFCIPHAKSIVVAGNERNVIHACIFGHFTQSCALKPIGLKVHQARIIFDGNVAFVHYPFA